MIFRLRPVDYLFILSYYAPLFERGLGMKPNIHPTYKEVKITCSCGNVFTTRSTTEKDQISLDVCSSCHPFYTGTQKIVDTAGRVDRFRQKYGRKEKAAKPEADQTKSDKK